MALSQLKLSHKAYQITSTAIIRVIYSKCVNTMFGSHQYHKMTSYTLNNNCSFLYVFLFKTGEATPGNSFFFRKNITEKTQRLLLSEVQLSKN